MRPLGALEAPFGEDVGNLLLGLDVSQTNSWVSLEPFQKPVKGYSLCPVAMLQNRRTAFDHGSNDCIVIFHDQQTGALGQRLAYGLDSVNAHWVLHVYSLYR